MRTPRRSNNGGNCPMCGDLLLVSDLEVASQLPAALAATCDMCRCCRGVLVERQRAGQLAHLGDLLPGASISIEAEFGVFLLQLCVDFEDDPSISYSAHDGNGVLPVGPDGQPVRGGWRRVFRLVTTDDRFGADDLWDGAPVSDERLAEIILADQWDLFERALRAYTEGQDR